MRWLAIDLPDLALELLGPVDEAVVICSGPVHRPLIHAASRMAIAAGVRPGQPLSAALAIDPTLRHRVRDPDLEAESLTGLALWALQYSSLVHPLDAGVLLEVGGSLGLFGGLDALVGRLREELSALGHDGRLAVAPTPLGAWLLARNRPGLVVGEPTELRSRLEALPLSGLEIPAETRDRLHGLGLNRVGDCLSLPRDALARRLGPELLNYLDRALGLRPDPREPFSPPPRFHRRIQLPADVESVEPLLFAARRLVLELVGLLRSRAAGVQTMSLRLEHRRQPPSRVELSLARPSRDPDLLLDLLRERMARIELPAPIEALVLEADRFPALECPQPDLFDGARGATVDCAALMETLRARLGDTAVTALRPQADHRPERAWRTCLPDEAVKGRGIEARPLWLLSTPEPLRSHQGVPWLGTELRLHQGPERIESGWWDGADASRDYFVAEGGQGERFWIYRDRRGGGWYLQGVFG